MSNSSESTPPSVRRDKLTSPQPRPVRLTMMTSVCSTVTFLLSLRRSFSQCCSSFLPVSALPISDVACQELTRPTSGPPWAGDPVQDVVSPLYCRDRREPRSHRMGRSNLLPLLPRQIDAISHPDRDDYQRPDTLGCCLLYHPCGNHPSPRPMLQPSKAQDV